MAAELTYTNGKANLFSVGETPWHSEGTILADAPTYVEALKLGGFDYPMKKMPYLFPNPNVPTGYQEAGDAFYVLREDTQKILGSVGGSYEIVTNEDAFRPLQPLVDEGVLKLETGGVLRDGADAWLMGRWDFERFGDNAKEVFGNEITPYATVCANHNGKRGILLGNTPIRIVCANTLGAAEQSGLSRWATVNHTRGANKRLIEAAKEMFHAVIERYEIIARQYRLLMGTFLQPEQFSQLILDIVCPDPRELPNWNPEAKMAESVVARMEKKRARLSDLWHNGKGHDGRPTAWYGYNAVVEALDHDRELFPTKAGCYRTASLLTGKLAELKNSVLDSLVNYAMGI
jgi:phage/plasmid-like protein (TIGR03299 family)